MSEQQEMPSIEQLDMGVRLLQSHNELQKAAAIFRQDEPLSDEDIRTALNKLAESVAGLGIVVTNIALGPVGPEYLLWKQAKDRP